MSFLFPCAPTNSANRNTDPYDLLSWQDRNRTLAPPDRHIKTSQLWREFFQWKRIKEDVIHFTPFDHLPPDQRDAIKARRFRSFQDSNIPWQVTDITSFLTGLDDIDDMAKSIRFVKDYAVAPVRRLFGPKGPLIDGDEMLTLERLRETCRLRADARRAKLSIVNATRHGFLNTAGAAALALLFPYWKFAALGLQFLQTLDGFFGVGMQLGPVMGLIAETTFRGLDELGLPFGPENNKYNQILGARVTTKSPRLLAAHNVLHPEDQLTTWASLYVASERQILPYMFIPPDEYPTATDIFTHPVTQLQHFARLFDSIPYNMVASVVNGLAGPLLDNWGEALSHDRPIEPTRHVPNSLERRVIGLAEHQICPSTLCNASIWQHLGIENNVAQRLDPISHQLKAGVDFFKTLLWDTTYSTPTTAR